MDLDETWQVGLRPEKTKPCTFPAKSCYEFRREREKMGRRGIFCQVNDAPLLPLSLDRFPPNFPGTRVQVVARNTWFHIPEKFPLGGWVSQKNVFFMLFPSPSGHPTDISYLGDFCWGMYRFPAIHLRKSSFATVSAMDIPGWRHSHATWRVGSPICSCILIHCTFSSLILGMCICCPTNITVTFLDLQNFRQLVLTIFFTENRCRIVY